MRAPSAIRRAIRRARLARPRASRIEYAWVGAPRARRAAASSSCTRASARSRCGRTFRARFCDARRLRAASSSRAPATAARRRGRATSAGRPTSCTARRDEVLPRAASPRVGIDAALAVRPQRRRLDRAAARGALSRSAGVVAVAPHLFVEDVSIASIEKARDAYETTDLRARLARYHDDLDSAFRGWNDVWLSPGVSRLEHRGASIATIACPVLAVQGERRRVRHAGADPRRSRASVPRRAAARARRLRPLAAPRPARAADPRGRRASSPAARLSAWPRTFRCSKTTASSASTASRSRRCRSTPGRACPSRSIRTCARARSRTATTRIRCCSCASRAHGRSRIRSGKTVFDLLLAPGQVDVFSSGFLMDHGWWDCTPGEVLAVEIDPERVARRYVHDDAAAIEPRHACCRRAIRSSSALRLHPRRGRRRLPLGHAVRRGRSRWRCCRGCASRYGTDAGDAAARARMLSAPAAAATPSNSSTPISAPT